jgi:hypothetical protein
VKLTFAFRNGECLVRVLLPTTLDEGLKARGKLGPGAEVEVVRRDGSTTTVTLGRIVRRETDAMFYSIDGGQ